MREATGRPAVRGECGLDLAVGRVEIFSMSVAWTLHVPKATKSSHQLPCNLQEMVDTGKFSCVSNFPETPK